MFRDDLPRDIQYVREHAGRSLSFLATNALFTGCYASVVAPMDTATHFRLSGEATAALFSVGFATKKPVTFTIKDENVTTEDGVDESHLHAGRWLNAFYLAVISHESATLDRLCKISGDDLKKSSTTSPAYRYLFVEALRHFWLKKEGVDQLFLDAMKGADPELPGAPKMWVLQIDVPLIHTFYYAISDKKEFNEALLAGVEKHKQHWSKGKLKDDCEGFTSLGLTAAAALAKGRGLEIAVESDYIPDYLIGDGFK
jgi:hypothetical protein